MGERRFGFLQRLTFLSRGHRYQALRKDEEEASVSLVNPALGTRDLTSPPPGPPLPGHTAQLSTWS